VAFTLNPDSEGDYSGRVEARRGINVLQEEVLLEVRKENRKQQPPEVSARDSNESVRYTVDPRTRRVEITGTLLRDGKPLRNFTDTSETTDPVTGNISKESLQPGNYTLKLNVTTQDRTYTETERFTVKPETSIPLIPLAVAALLLTAAAIVYINSRTGPDTSHLDEIIQERQSLNDRDYGETFGSGNSQRDVQITDPHRDRLEDI
jgi:hypothetical protein